jgi:RNase P subunit RPR2
MLAPTSSFATTAPCARAATRAASRRASVAARASATPNASTNVPVTSATVVDRRAFVRNAALVAFTAAVTTPREVRRWVCVLCIDARKGANARVKRARDATELFARA